MFRLLAIAAGVYLVYRLLRSSKKPKTPRAGPGQIEDEMVQCPHCGTYFPRSQGLPAKVDGQRLLFCSEKCRQAYLDRYKARHKKPQGEDDQ
ncbi:MAG: hypothetical protein JRJ59_11130 [Deltaproteobacteria bacterium]|nr:hypothetical protein [Deltaproteobacteria bacterium]